MAIRVGGKRLGPAADINVTPLIDIVLVLLIILMVLGPPTQRAYDLSIPEKAPPTELTTVVSADQLILMMRADGRIQLNSEETSLQALRGKLEVVLRNRRDKIVFFQAHEDVGYQAVIQVMEEIRASGGTPGLVTTELSPAG